MIFLASKFANIRLGTRGVALLRCGLALIVATYLLIHFNLRQELWGPHGVYDLATFSADKNSLRWVFETAASPVVFDIVYVAMIIVSLLYVAGVATRIMSWLFALSFASLVARNPYAIDAGQTVIVLLAFLLCFSDSGQYLTVARKSAARTQPTLLSIVHNCARFLIYWQMCMIYLWAAFYKLEGLTWHTGTAMFYIMRLEDLQTLPPLANALSSNSLLVAVLTYSTVFFQMAFPFLIWNKKAKPFVVGAGVAFHIGIASMMGLWLFSATMIVADISLLSDAQLGKIASKIGRCKMHIVRTIQGRAPTSRAI